MSFAGNSGKGPTMGWINLFNIFQDKHVLKHKINCNYFSNPYLVDMKINSRIHLLTVKLQ